YAPVLGLRAFGFQPLSRLNRLTRQATSCMLKPAARVSVQPICRLPLYALQSGGAGGALPPPGPRLSERLAGWSPLFRAASSAALACAAAAVAASSALVCASF